MLKVGLTGGIGSGKSTAATMFIQLGAAVVDTDLIARALLQKGQPLLESVRQHFGDSLFRPDGELDRSRLREQVFSRPDQLPILEQLLHPAIRQEVHAAIARLDAPYVLIAIPLLVEKGWQDVVDRVLVVDCAETQQLARAGERDGASPALIQRIMAQQVTRAERLAAADDILHNDGSIEALHAQVHTLHQHYLKMSYDQPCKAIPSTNIR